jgi:hypothetical protein
VVFTGGFADLSVFDGGKSWCVCGEVRGKSWGVVWCSLGSKKMSLFLTLFLRIPESGTSELLRRLHFLFERLQFR